MRAAIFKEPKRVEAGDRPDATLHEATDAVVRVVLACLCGSDLWYYRGDSSFEPGPISHEFIGVVEETGADVSNLTVVAVATVSAPELRGRRVRLVRARAV